MTHHIVDRRKNDKNKSLGNRKRFIDRIKEDLKESVKRTIKNSNIGDVLSSNKKKVTIPGKGLNKPNFNYSADGGVMDYVLPGNDRFHEGDKIAKPQNEEADGEGEEGGSDGEGEDSFSFMLTREEFLDIIFEDMELPNLVRKEFNEVVEVVPRRAGFTKDGPPSRLNVLRSMRQSKARRLALRLPKQKKLRELQEELAKLMALPADKQLENSAHIKDLEEQIEVLKRKIQAVPFLDEMDLRYHRWENQPTPVTKAVVFAVMDVSGSMGEWEKDMAKRFFLFLRVFLEYNYEKVEIVWIRYHSDAREVTEHEFFNDRDNGGTNASTGLMMVSDAIKNRYPPNIWNIFVSQISDGDNASSDNPLMIDVLKNDILPKSQYYTYVETRKVTGQIMNPFFGITSSSTLFPIFKELEKVHPNLKASVVNDAAAIFPVFRKLFEKKTKNVA